ncbi:1-deoxy-D-xylulose-5-phosphate synthase [Capnocytophaga haemolytica]
MKQLLQHINSPADVRKLPVEALPALAEELRAYIIEVMSERGGHLGASLGVVELTVALHYVFNTPSDPLIWDVGHQCYAHKILTGRREAFRNIRQEGGISGFPKREESTYDVFGTGHSSTSLSVTLGMAMAADLAGDKSQVHIAVIGDASIVSGMAFEALNYAGTTQANMLIVLNDNAMAIDPTVGALATYFSGLRAGEEDTFFADLNITYKGKVDGHNLPALITALEAEKDGSGVRLLHVITTKGKGLAQAEQQQSKYHSTGAFDKVTGLPFTEKTALPDKYQDVVGKTLTELALNNPRIVAITPAMTTGSGLLTMKAQFPDRVLDVGIAEQHAVTFAAGWAVAGFVPYCVVYSTFLQRAYDQLIHDVALQNLPVVFCIDRAGLVEDGATHHGVFDIGFLRVVPNLVIASPRNATELRNLLYTAQEGLPYPIAIRYPRGRCHQQDWQQAFESIPIGKGVVLKEGSEVAVISIGTTYELALEQIAQAKEAERFGLFDIRFLKPLDEDLLQHIFQKYKVIITIEEGSAIGGLGSAIAAFAAKGGYTNTLKIVGLPDRFVTEAEGRTSLQQGLASALKEL